jgi:hypothetical protein
MNSLPSLFFIFGVLAAAILWFTATPDFKPENFAGMDQFAEISTGCQADQIMEDCINDIVETQTQFSKYFDECNNLPLIQRASCVSQLQEQYNRMLEETKVQYQQKIPLTATVSEFYRQLAADQINELAEKNEETFKLLFAVGAFSIISGLGGLVNMIVAPITTILTKILLVLGTIKKDYRSEEVISYYLE